MSAPVAHQEFVKANEKYVAEFTEEKAKLNVPPTKKLTVVTCMDARLDPAAHLGLKEGDAHIIRNAGGVAKDALRSIIISQRLLGTREIAIFHHTGCGMLSFSTPHLRDIIKSQRPTRPQDDEEVSFSAASLGKYNQNVIAAEVDKIDFLEFGDVENSAKDDVKWIKDHPLILRETKVTGWVYEVETGKVRQVV